MTSEPIEATVRETPNPADEPLGNGDAGKLFQQFQLRRSPLTYLPSEAGVSGAASPAGEVPSG